MENHLDGYFRLRGERNASPFSVTAFFGKRALAKIRDAKRRQTSETLCIFARWTV